MMFSADWTAPDREMLGQLMVHPRLNRSEHVQLTILCWADICFEVAEHMSPPCSLRFHGLFVLAVWANENFSTLAKFLESMHCRYLVQGDLRYRMISRCLGHVVVLIFLLQ